MSSALKQLLEPAAQRRPFHKFTVAKYHDMIRHGILTEDDDVELLDGFIIKKASNGTPPTVHRLSVTQYQQLIQYGILTEDDPVELLEGWIMTKMPRNPAHDGTIWFVQAVVQPLVAPQWIVRCQSAITTPDSEPEPDVAVVRAPASKYLRTHPVPKDIGMLVEVADSSIDSDREQKGRVFARARIPIYWIINLADRQIEVYTQPRGGKSPAYRKCQVYGIDGSVPLILGTKLIAHLPVRDLLPEPPAEQIGNQ